MSTILADALIESQHREPAEVLDLFLEWVEALRIELYDAQEEAIFEIFDDNHVILNTPTGSGKSLVAVAMHFFAASRSRRSFYTSPIKALVSEKFFSLCNTFGAQHVGMMTGDASVNTQAPIICCTAEVLANMALRQGSEVDVDYVIMDEFHYYSDHDRGWAWQVPLLLLPKTAFLLMSATLGDMTPIIDGLTRDTKRETSVVTSTQRPVPLEFDYVETSLHETIVNLAESNKTPTYIVNFSQRECAELAQACTSINFIETEEKRRIRSELGDFRFESPYGKDVRSYLQKGIGIHHAGLLPKYRLLVERMAQEGKLKLIIGTDTLGVGINVPIRSVLFTRLYKYDGQSTALLSVRDFKQIAGRAGRKGFDTRGYVVCQAPAHVIENKKLEVKASRGKKVVKSSQPRGFVNYDEDIFLKLARSKPEQLEPRFQLNHGILVQLLQRDTEDSPLGTGYRKLVVLIAASHQNDWEKSQLRKQAAELFRALSGAGLIEIQPNDSGVGSRAYISEELQEDFSLFHTLSLYLIEALEHLNMNTETFALDLLTLVESILENPQAVLYKQIDLMKTELMRELKADGVDYEDRIEELEKVTHDKPNEEFIYDTFNEFRARHPWVHGENVRPKSIARDMVERYMNFSEYVNEYGLARSEGVLLRYLSQVYKTLIQNVPEGYKTDKVIDLIAYLRTVLGRADSSLLEEWEGMSGEVSTRTEHDEALPEVAPIWTNQKFVEARIRTEAHELVRALSRQDWESATAGVRNSDEWTEERFAEVMQPYFAEYSHVRFDHQARFPKWSRIEKSGPKSWTLTQTILDEVEDNFWYFKAEIDFEDAPAPDEPWLTLETISS